MVYAKPLGGRFDLEPSKARRAIEHLAREIGKFDGIRIDQADPLGSGTHQCRCGRNTQPSHTDYQNSVSCQLALTPGP